MGVVVALDVAVAAPTKPMAPATMWSMCKAEAASMTIALRESDEDINAGA